MGVPEKVLQVIRETMKGWKTQQGVKDDGKIKVIVDGSTLEKGSSLQGDSYSPVGFDLLNGDTSSNVTRTNRWL